MPLPCKGCFSKAIHPPLRKFSSHQLNITIKTHKSKIAGIYGDNEKLKDLLGAKMVKAPSQPTKDMYQMVIDSDVAMMVRLVITYSGLTMSLVRKNFDEGIGASIKKLTGRKNEELTKKYTYL